MRVQPTCPPPRDTAAPLMIDVIALFAFAISADQASQCESDRHSATENVAPMARDSDRRHRTNRVRPAKMECRLRLVRFLSFEAHLAGPRRQGLEPFKFLGIVGEGEARIIKSHFHHPSAHSYDGPTPSLKLDSRPPSGRDCETEANLVVGHSQILTERMLTAVDNFQPRIRKGESQPCSFQDFDGHRLHQRHDRSEVLGVLKNCDDTSTPLVRK